jgi:hypothetical protein
MISSQRTGTPGTTSGGPAGIREDCMSDKRGDSAGGGAGSKALNTVAALGAAFVARKVATVAWTKITGKEPPSDPEDPAVGMAEALGWAIAVGAVVAAVRVLAVRAATARTRHHATESPSS